MALVLAIRSTMNDSMDDSECQDTDDGGVPQMHPDQIAHVLSVSESEPVRVFLEDREATVPLEPVTERGGCRTQTVPGAYFDAIVEFVDVADGGETLWTKFHLPKSEWRRLRLHKHWEQENAEDWRHERILDSWASRFANQIDSTDDDGGYTSPAPDDSPTVTVYEDHDFDIDDPPAPFDRPSLEMEAATADSVRDYGNAWTTIDVGTIRAVVQRTELSEQPVKRDVEPPELPEPPSPHPAVDFDGLSSLPHSEDVLEAVYTINRHAKDLDEKAEQAYRTGQGAEARAHSVRKKALYSVKTIALHRLVKDMSEQVSISRHEIHGVEMYCLRLSEDYSFHQPLDAVADELLDAVGCDDSDVHEINFTRSTDVSSLDQSLQEALSILADDGIDVNEHLETTTVEDYEFGYTISTTFSW